MRCFMVFIWAVSALASFLLVAFMPLLCRLACESFQWPYGMIGAPDVVLSCGVMDTCVILVVGLCFWLIASLVGVFYWLFEAKE